MISRQGLFIFTFYFEMLVFVQLKSYYRYRTSSNRPGLHRASECRPTLGVSSFRDEIVFVYSQKTYLVSYPNILFEISHGSTKFFPKRVYLLTLVLTFDVNVFFFVRTRSRLSTVCVLVRFLRIGIFTDGVSRSFTKIRTHPVSVRNVRKRSRGAYFKVVFF